MSHLMRKEYKSGTTKVNIQRKQVGNTGTGALGRKVSMTLLSRDVVQCLVVARSLLLSLLISIPLSLPISPCVFSYYSRCVCISDTGCWWTSAYPPALYVRCSFSLLFFFFKLQRRWPLFTSVYVSTLICFAPNYTPLSLLQKLSHKMNLFIPPTVFLQ